MAERAARGQKRAAKVQARRQRLAHDELRREEHARLVTERVGDPRFVQRVSNPDGSATVSWSPDTPAGREIQEGLDAQTAAFRKKFGRDPGPEDPLVFDPDADEPTSVTDERMDALFEEMIDAAERAGVDPAFVKAWQDVGYIVTEDTRHLFSAAEIEAWSDAVEWHSDLDDDEEFASDDEIDLDDVLSVLDTVLRGAVTGTLETRTTEPACAMSNAILAGDAAAAEESDGSDPGEDGAMGLSLAFAVLANWLTGMRERHLNVQLADEALTWVRTELGEASAAAAAEAAGLLGGGERPYLTVQELQDALGTDFLPALVWLTAGAVAQFGDGDVASLPTQLDR